MSSPEVEIARQQWQAADRRLEAMRDDPPLYRRLHDQLDALVDELRRRVGQTFTLGELVRAYREAELWTLEALEAADPEPGWERHASLVADAAFHRYARGAVDFGP